MKVFVVSGKHPLRDGGGYAPYARSVARCLVEAGHEVHVITMSGEDGVERTDFGAIHTVPGLKRLRTEGFPYWCGKFAEYIHGLLEPGEACVLHGIGVWGYTGVLLRERHRRRVTLLASYFTTLDHEVGWLRKSAVVADYGLAAWSKFAAVHLGSRLLLRRYERRLLEDCDRIVVHYESTKRQIQHEFGVPDFKFAKAAYYVELYAKSGHAAGANGSAAPGYPSPLVVAVCRQEPRKGMNHLIRALAILRDRGVAAHAVLAGSGAFLEANRALVRRLGLEDRVTLPGFVRDIDPLLASADVFVLSSLQEGSGAISVLEAMHAGVPVVTTDCDGMPEDIADGENGLVVPAGDARALADAVERILADPALGPRLAARATKTLERFAFEGMQSDLARLYASLGTPAMPVRT